MRVAITPSRACGTVSAPPSKSMAHRALICAALSGGSTVVNVALSRDIEVTLDCLEKLGTNISYDNGTFTLGGLDPSKIPDGCEIYCHESGSTLRFLIPLCMLAKGHVTLSGAPRLMERPQTVYEELAKELQIDFLKRDGKIIVGGGLCAGDFSVRGDVSSQFITGLLIALSTLPQKSTLHVTGKFESASYTDLTISALTHFGKDATRRDRVFTILPSSFKKTCYRVEGDYSNSAYLDALSVIGGEVEVTGLLESSLQGDAVYRDFFKKMKEGFNTFDISGCPDNAPILFALAAVLNGAEFTGTSRLKIKESDRAEAMKCELAKLGAHVTVEENRVVVPKTEITPPASPISSHNDHRIAMAMAVLLTLTGGEIEGAEAVTKSFPDFWDKLQELQIGLKIYA